VCPTIDALFRRCFDEWIIGAVSVALVALDAFAICASQEAVRTLEGIALETVCGAHGASIESMDSAFELGFLKHGRMLAILAQIHGGDT
jgi:hypothetical protein